MSRKVANRPALDTIISDSLTRISLAETIERLARGEIAYGRVNGVAELSRHPALRRIQIATPTGSVSLPAAPARWTEGGDLPGHVPELGADDRKIRREFTD